MYRSFIVLTLSLAAATAPSQPTTTVYTVDAKASDVRAHVDRAGLFSFVGHTHEVRAPVASGTVEVAAPDVSRSTARLVFEASALRVTGQGEPEHDVPEVQRTMESEQVLDVSRFPQITFVSSEIQVIERKEERWRLRITGALTLHGRTKSEHADVSVIVTGPQLRADGTLVVRQTDYGIEPVTAGGGTVRVKDAVRITFAFVARRAH